MTSDNKPQAADREAALSMRPHRRLPVRYFLAGVFAAFFVGCFDDGGIVGSSTVTGTYTLRSINGAPLPYTISGSGTNKTEIVSESITLFRGDTYARERITRITVNGQASSDTTTEGGSYSLFGTSISMRASGTGPLIQAVINGNTMTFVEAGLTSVFSK